MFKIVKSFKKEDLKWALQELIYALHSTFTIPSLKELILNSKEHEKDPDFVQDLIENAFAERKL